MHFVNHIIVLFDFVGLAQFRLNILKNLSGSQKPNNWNQLPCGLAGSAGLQLNSPNEPDF